MPGRSKLGGFDQDHAKTPGPARYGVTSADITRRTAPNFSIQSRNYMPEGQEKLYTFYIHSKKIKILM